MAMLQVTELSTNHIIEKRNATSYLTFFTKYNYVGLSDAPLRPRPAIIVTQSVDKGNIGGQRGVLFTFDG